MCRGHLQTGSLGQGTFGIVIKALDLRSDPPTEVAIKLLPRGDFVRSPDPAPAPHLLCSFLIVDSHEHFKPPNYRSAESCESSSHEECHPMPFAGEEL